ncbi:hypothetical protein J421_4662 (plasmid) [Gemmatirosa kalamazoonensis]|uniref:Uncharacterized protein n=1 Tax=Gemmatirosa kalamazoonensis TaxID=861299 RepID=W0RM28_9BACT|nr:hypothetical protein [Gemmatirosa kalamazoonensis]AHG92129.1 hypothetical protein J421_4594 [Gemmatirosa kalamazoonensis]AHG92197.1 hypothetical protein J421_4662 [Gemmatirosa kalamazoonensis]
MPLPTTAIAGAFLTAMRAVAPARGAALLEVPNPDGVTASGPPAYACTAAIVRQRRARDTSGGFAVVGRAVISTVDLPVIPEPTHTLVTTHPVTGDPVRWTITAVKDQPGCYAVEVAR